MPPNQCEATDAPRVGSGVTGRFPMPAEGFDGNPPEDRNRQVALLPYGCDPVFVFRHLDPKTSTDPRKHGMKAQNFSGPKTSQFPPALRYYRLNAEPNQPRPPIQPNLTAARTQPLVRSTLWPQSSDSARSHGRCMPSQSVYRCGERWRYGGNGGSAHTAHWYSRMGGRVPVPKQRPFSVKRLDSRSEINKRS